MEKLLNYPNLLAFVQVGVAMNFGLLFISGKNILKDIYREYQSYLKAISSECINYATEQMKLVEVTGDEEKRKQKASVRKCLNKMNHIFSRQLVCPHLSCWGVYSGLFGFVFLYVVGMLNWKFDSFLLDLLIVQAEVVLLLEIFAWIRLGNRRKLENVRALIAMNFQWFVVLSVFAFGMVAKDWIIHVPISRDFCFLLCSLVAYAPVLWLVGIMLVDLIRVYYWKKMCRINVDCLMC